MPDPRQEREGGLAIDQHGRQLVVFDTPFAAPATTDVKMAGLLVSADGRRRLGAVDDAGNPQSIGGGVVTPQPLAATPHPGADYTVAKDSAGYFAVDKDGDEFVRGADVGGQPATQTNSGFPGSFVVDGTTAVSGAMTTSGLKTVLDAIKGADRWIHFSAGVYDFGFNTDFNLSNLPRMRFSGDGIDRTFITHFTTGTADLEPFSFSLADRILMEDMTVSAGGGGTDKPGSGASDGTSSDALDFDQGKFCTVRRVKVIAARDKAIVFDGKEGVDLGVSTANGYGNRVYDCIIDGTLVAAPSTDLSVANGGAGNVDAGAHTWKLVRVDYLSRMSVASTGAALTLASASSVTVTLPAIQGSGATRDKGYLIYRSTAGTSDFYMVGGVFGGATSFVDNVSDANLQVLTSDQTSRVPNVSALRTANIHEGIRSYSSSRDFIHDNVLRGTVSHMLNLERSASAVHVRGGRYENNRFEVAAGASNTCLNVGDAIGCVVTGNIFNGGTDGTRAGVGLRLSVTASTGLLNDIVVRNNVFHSLTTGLTSSAAFGAASGVVDGNTFQNNATNVSDTASQLIYAFNPGLAGVLATSSTSAITQKSFEHTVFFTATANQSITVPTPVGRAGQVLRYIKTATGGTVTLTSAAGSIVGDSTLTTVNERLDLVSNGTNWYGVATVA